MIKIECLKFNKLFNLSYSDKKLIKNLITLQNIHKTYTGNIEAVKRLYFDVEEKTCCALLGPNGAGKSSVMRMLYGHSLCDKKEGSLINVFGLDPAKEELAIKYQTGVVPQENNLDEELTVFQNLILFARFYGMSREKAEKRIDELLLFMDLSDRKNSAIKTLSGGMMRRLIIARALINNPKLLILDEPTTGLDPQVRQLIWDKLYSLKKQGVTIMLCTHYMEEAFHLCDKIIIMHNGEKITEGNPKKLLKEHIEDYVLEIMATDYPEVSDECMKNIRVDKLNERVLMYADNMECLKTVMEQLADHAHYLRQANLEDLFLKITGRGINEN